MDNPHVSHPYKPSIPYRFAKMASLIGLVGMVLAGCANQPTADRAQGLADMLRSKAYPAAQGVPSTEADTRPHTETNVGTSDPAFFRPGTGKLVKPAPQQIVDVKKHPDGNTKLNFKNADLLEVVKVILGDLLKVNYTVDPTIQGVVSMQTTYALPQDDLVPTLELLLRMNNAALIKGKDIYRVVPFAKALAEVQAPQLGDSTVALPAGFSVKVVPLKYISATEMAQILEPFMADANQLLRVDSARNLLIIASASEHMERLLDMINMFDVDRMAGMSVALFTPDFVDAKTLAEELKQLLSDPTYGLMPGLVHFIVVDRLNGLIAVTPKPEHLIRIREWVERLDRNFGDANRRLFVYRVQNGKAKDIADTLNTLFNNDSRKDKGSPEVAPGLKPVTIGEGPAAAEAGPNKPEKSAPSRPESPEAENPVTDASQGLAIDNNARVQIIADEPNNALLILAKGSEYRQILAALKQLDVSPMQVLIEVTIAEVTLTDNLSYGVEWFFRNHFGSKSGVATLDLGTSGLSHLQPGFSYALEAPGGAVQAVLNALATESNLSVISSPSLLVLNNEEATIQIGDEVPVSTQQQQSTAVNANIINSIEYRNTGILLNVKPRINAGGLVIMEVEQEASQVPTTNNADPLTPRIRQRKIKSTVAVNSGNTIILGGLIEGNHDQSASGVPFLHKVPVLGTLFGTKADNNDRTELIVLITPRAISDSTAALQVTESFRRRVQKLIPERSSKK